MLKIASHDLCELKLNRERTQVNYASLQYEIKKNVIAKCEK